MKKFECTSCTHRKCTCELEDTLCSPPQNCINKYVSFIPNWHEVEEKTTTKSSRFPDWVKECAIGYDNEQERYFEVTNIDKKWVDIEYLDDGIGATCDYSDIQKCSEARKRPFNAEEMRGLVGKVIKTPKDIAMVLGYSGERNKVCVATMNNYFTAEALLAVGATLNGNPCGKLEHLENGECVE
jgi:hypothetical protein